MLPHLLLSLTVLNTDGREWRYFTCCILHTELRNVRKVQERTCTQNFFFSYLFIFIIIIIIFDNKHNLVIQANSNTRDRLQNNRFKDERMMRSGD